MKYSPVYSLIKKNPTFTLDFGGGVCCEGVPRSSVRLPFLGPRSGTRPSPENEAPQYHRHTWARKRGRRGCEIGGGVKLRRSLR